MPWLAYPTQLERRREGPNPEGRMISQKAIQHLVRQLRNGFNSSISGNCNNGASQVFPRAMRDPSQPDDSKDELPTPFTHNV